jgi:alpha-beta hydrolase superfamily lysophospholipase
MRDDAIRTPEARFANLPDFPFQPRYREIQGYRVHYLDEGPQDGPPVFMLHGEPAWGFLYRKMIPVLTAAGFRSIVPDLIGFGRSDKPRSRKTHSYPLHVEIMTELFRGLDLENATFFGQDWGGLIGLRVVANEPDRFARIVVTSSGIIHDIRADGTLAHGANDVNPSCMRIFAAGQWVRGVFELHPFGGPALVRRRRDGDELVWDYPGIGTTRMRRICRVP